MAALAVIASGLAYEVFLPLFVLTAAFLFIADLAADWPRSKHKGAIAEAALRLAVIVIPAVLVVFLKGMWAPRVPQNIDVMQYLQYIRYAVTKAVLIDYGYHLLLMPYTVWHVLSGYSGVMLVTTAAIIGILIFIRLYTLPDPAIGWAGSRADLLIYLASGIALFVAGYSLFPPVPVENGIQNRTAIAGTLGVAISIVAVLALLAYCLPRTWRKLFFSTAVTAIGMGGALIICAVSNFWVESFRMQQELLSDIRDHVPEIRAGSSFILDGVCPYNGPAPLFSTTWDLSGALSIVYGHDAIAANIVTRSMTVEADGLAVPAGARLTIYPYGELYIYQFGRKTSYAIPEPQAAHNYFRDISVDREDRCPADADGNGVDVLNGSVAKFRAILKSMK